MTEWKWFLARNRGMLMRGGDFFGELIRREIPRWAEVVKAGNVKPD